MLPFNCNKARKLNENALRHLTRNLANVNWNDVLTMDVELIAFYIHVF